MTMPIDCAIIIVAIVFSLRFLFDASCDLVGRKEGLSWQKAL